MNYRRESKFTKITAPLFYVFVIAFLIVGAYILYQDKETFYLDDKDITMPINSDYTIRFLGMTESKEASDFNFTSSNESVAIVDENGKVHTVGSGNTTISVISKTSKFTQTLNITVSEDNAYIIEFDTDEILLKEKEQLQLRPLINGEKNYNVDLNYSSSNKNVATITKSGKVTAVKSGVSYITVKIKGTDISYRLRVIVQTKQKDVISDNNNTVKNNTKTTKKVTTTKKTVKEKTTDDTNEDGFNIVVNNHIYVSNVDLKASKNKLKVGETLKLTYKVIPENATNQKVTFSSNNTNVATVDSKGTVTAKKAGSVDISIKTDEGKYTRFVTLTVEDNIVNVSSITLNKSQTSILRNGTEKLAYTINPSNATNKKVTWKSSNTSIVTVDSNGNIKGIAPGNATITVTSNDGNKTSKCNVTVKEKAISVTGVSLNKTSISLNSGETVKLSATITPSNATNQVISFKSNNTSVATVDANGTVKAVGAGTTDIIVTTADGNKTAKCTVTVKEILVKEISLNVSDFQIKVGETKKIGYSIKPSDATDKTIKWTSSDSSIASIDSNGNLKALKIGWVYITATNTKSGVKKRIVVAVSTKDNLINIKNSKYNKYVHNIATIEENNGGSYKHMQNFAIANYGKSNQIIYLTTVQNSNYSSSKELTEEKKGNLSRSIIYKVTNANLDNPNRPKMYLENAGHGQAFDIEPNGEIMWINAIPRYEESGGAYWGRHNGLMKIKFKETPTKGKYTSLLEIIAKDKNGNEKLSPEPSIDYENDLILIRSGNRFYIYKYSSFSKGKQELIYWGKLVLQAPETYDNGDSIYYQGIALKGGYIYLFRGRPGRDAYIEAFNLLGESMYYKKLNDESNYKITKHREPEGIHVYDGKIFIGSSHYVSETDSNSLFDIGYYVGK